MPAAVRLLLLLGVLGASGRGEAEAPPPTPPPPRPAAIAPLDAPVPCYSGPAATKDVGICRAGVRTFPDGPCVGEVLPMPETCNGEDDDCNGVVDDGLGTISCGVGACTATAPACVGGEPGTCTPRAPGAETCDGLDHDCNGTVDDGCACVHVLPTGDDGGPGTSDRPMRTIAAAIRRAAEPGQPRRVCVAAGPTCPASADFREPLEMVNGVSVFGGFAAAGPVWQRGACVTRLVSGDPRGVRFDASVESPTILDGFTIVGADAPETVAVTIEGSTGAVLSNDVVQGGRGTTSYGVRILATDHPATPRLLRNTISGGGGSTRATGIGILRSAPVIHASCALVDGAGRCVSDGCSGPTGFIRGHSVGPLGMESVGILVEDSPDTTIVQNTVCAGQVLSFAAGIAISGDARNVEVRGNRVLAVNGRQAVGIAAGACAGASPRIVDNSTIGARDDAEGGRAVGIRATGDCHPRIERNALVIGNQSGRADATGIECDRDAETHDGSACVVVANHAILANGGGLVPAATGIRCGELSCARISRNDRISGVIGIISTGVSLASATTLVDRNRIEAGCGVSGAAGITAVDSAARIENNLISGGECPPTSAPTMIGYGVRVLTRPGGREVDLHSNTIAARGASARCTSCAVSFEPSGPGSDLTRRGMLRNNVLDGGRCDKAFAVDEAKRGIGPRVVLNNDLWASGGYRAEGAREFHDLGALGTLPGLTVRENLASDPHTGDQGLAPDSPCRNAGAAEGAPVVDFLGRRRPAEERFDIGAHEFVP